MQMGHVTTLVTYVHINIVVYVHINIVMCVHIYIVVYVHSNHQHNGIFFVLLMSIV